MAIQTYGPSLREQMHCGPLIGTIINDEY